MQQPFGIYLTHSLHHFKQSGSAGDSIRLQRRGDSKTDGLFCPAGICHHQMGGHGIQIPFHTLHGSVERLQIDGDIRSAWGVF